MRPSENPSIPRLALCQLPIALATTAGAAPVRARERQRKAVGSIAEGRCGVEVHRVVVGGGSSRGRDGVRNRGHGRDECGRGGEGEVGVDGEGLPGGWGDGGDEVAVVGCWAEGVAGAVAASTVGFVESELGGGGHGWGLFDGFVDAVAGFGQLDVVPEVLFVVGDAVGEDDADVLVEVEAAFGRAADVEMDEVAQALLALRVGGSGGGGGRLGTGC